MCIILAPGKGRTRSDFLPLTPELHDAGYGLMMFDPRSTGESEGDKWGFGYFESRDILAGIKFLKSNYGCERFGLLGVSTGASASLMAALTSKDVSAVVSDSAFASIQLAAESYGNYGTKPFFRLTFPLYMFGAKRMLGIDIAEKTDLKERVKSLKTPVMFIHGDGDQLIGVKNARVLYENKPEIKELWVARGAGHGRTFEMYSEEYLVRVIDFFDTYL